MAKKLTVENHSSIIKYFNKAHNLNIVKKIIIMHFTPKALRLFSQDNKIVYVYPNIISLTNNLECTLAWFTILTNINNSAYDKTLKYLVLGTITETSSDIKSFFNTFRTFTLDFIKDPKNLTVLSYHGANRLRIPSTVHGSGQL